MDAKAVLKFGRVSPRKIRKITDTIKGKSYSDALAYLEFLPTPNSQFVKKLLMSAAANAENNYEMVKDYLFVQNAFVNQGPTLRRIRYGSMGRVGRIRKRTSHITIVLTEKK